MIRFTFLLFIFLLFFSCSKFDYSESEISQKTFNQLISSLDLSNNQTYVINFWATWCSPCIKEIPHFEYVNKKFDNNLVKVLLVSLDLPNHFNSKLVPFVKKNNIKSNVIHLTDINLNEWMPKISDEWNGGIPATLIMNNNYQKFYPKPFEKDELIYEIDGFINNNTYQNGLGSR